MGQAPARTAKPEVRPAPARWQSIATIFAFISLLFISTPTFLILFIGMMPSIVAMIIDRTPARHAATAVGAMNAAGVMPFVFQLWFESHSVSGAQAILSNPFVLLAMYSAAAFGWLLFAAIPMLHVAVQQTLASRQVSALRKRQAELIAEWGENIRGSPTDPTRKGTRS